MQIFDQFSTSWKVEAHFIQQILPGNMLSTLSCAKATKYPCPQYYPNINTRGSARQKLRLCGV